MADGQIVIDSKILTDGIEIGVKAIESGLRRMAKNTASLLDSSRKAADQQIRAAKEMSTEATKKLEQSGSKEASAISEQLEEEQSRLDNLLKTKELFLQAGGNEDSSYFVNLLSDIDTLINSIQHLRGELEDLRGAGESDGQANQIIGPFKSMAIQLGNMVEFIKSSIVNLPKAAGTSLTAFVKNIISKLRALTKAAQKAAMAFAQLAGRGLLYGLKKISAGVLGIHKSVKKTTYSMARMIKMGLLMGAVYKAISLVTNSVKEAFQNLAQYSSETNTVLSGLMSSLTQLKNSFATAFSPILSAAAPALNYLIGLLNSATTAIAQFMAALTGSSTFVRAAKVQENYAESLSGTAGAAKEAEGALASFDKLNVQSEKSSGGGGAAGVTPSEMFETAPIENSFQNMADKIRALIRSEDWEGLGSYIASGMSAGLQKIYDVINWDNVGPKITCFVNAFANTFNSLANNLDWDLLGRTIGAGINTVVYSLNLLIEGIDWPNLGKKFGEGANGIVNEVDWKALGNLIGNKIMIIPQIVLGFVKEFDWDELGNRIGQGINGAVEKLDTNTIAASIFDLAKGLIDTINAILISVDWQGIGNKIAAFIGGIDYSGIATSLAYGIGAAIASAAEIIWGLIEDAWSKVVGWWNESAYKDGEFTIKGLLGGIVNAIKGIGAWIKKNIFEPFINGFKDAFEIHSPSAIMAEMGRFLMEGLKNGITELIPNVISAFSELGSKISNKWDEIKKNTSEKWGEIKLTLSSYWDELKEKSGTIFETVREKIVDVWSNIKNKTSELWGDGGISGVIAGCVNGIVSKAEAMINGIIDIMNGFIRKINGFHLDIPDNPITGKGFKLGFYIPTLDHVSVHLPRLASGTVVPPRAGEFAAILGDNNREAEVVSPISTIEKALENVIARTQAGSQEINLSINLDGRQIYKAVVDLNRANTKMTGRNAFVT